MSGAGQGGAVADGPGVGLGAEAEPYRCARRVGDESDGPGGLGDGVAEQGGAVAGGWWLVARAGGVEADDGVEVDDAAGLVFGDFDVADTQDGPQCFLGYACVVGELAGQVGGEPAPQVSGVGVEQDGGFATEEDAKSPTNCAKRSNRASIRRAPHCPVSQISRGSTGSTRHPSIAPLRCSAERGSSASSTGRAPTYRKFRPSNGYAEFRMAALAAAALQTRCGRRGWSPTHR